MIWTWPTWPNEVLQSSALAVLLALPIGPATAIARSEPKPAALERRLDAALAAGQIAEAKAIAESLMAVRGSRLAPAALPGALDSLGLRFFGLGTPEALQAAEGFFRQALAQRERTLGARHLEVASSLSLLATLLDYLGRWDEGLELERRSLAITVERLGPRHPKVAASQRQVGVFSLYLGRYDEAQAALERAFDIYAAQRPPEPERLADLLNSLGEVARVRDRHAAAESSFVRGLALARRELPRSHPITAVLVNNLAGVYKDQARYSEAEPLLVESLGLREAGQADPQALATAHLNLAEVRRLQGRLDEAEPLYRRGLELARQAFPPEHPELAPFINQAAVLYADLGRHEAAAPLYREALQLVERTLGPDHPLVAQSLHDLANLLRDGGQHAEAETLYRRAIAIRERRFGRGHAEPAATTVDLARSLSARGEGRAARAELERALAVLDTTRTYPESRLEAHALRARLRGASDRAGAIADLSRALALVDTLRAQRGGGDETRARFMARRQDLYDELIGWQVAAGDPAAAFLTYERARARLLLDQVTAHGVDLRAGIDPAALAPLAAEERAARELLAQAQRQLDEAARADLPAAARLEAVAARTAARDSAVWRFQRARTAIQDRSPLWRRALSTEGRAAPLDQVQRDLVPPAGLLLAYQVGARAAHVFVIPAAPGRVTVHRLQVDRSTARRLGIDPGPMNAERMERVVGGVRDSAAGVVLAGAADLLGGVRVGGAGGALWLAPLDSVQAVMHGLARVLVPSPIWRRVREASTVVVIPDGALHLLPFEALVVRWTRGAEADWLAEGPPLVYGSSATSLLGLARRGGASPRGEGPRVLSVANPTFAAEGEVASPGEIRAAAAPAADRLRAGRAWSALPGTEVEASEVRRAFAPESVLILTGTRATEREVRRALAGKRYLHFATHGFVTETRSDLLAGLVLAGARDSMLASDDDGFLQLYEIYDLDLACEAAVLSACETHRGPRIGGEGVFALSRGFLAAGARRVIATLWAARDRPAAEMMGGFFGRVTAMERRGGAADHARALRDAKRAVRARPEWEHPFNWAPFVLSGSP